MTASALLLWVLVLAVIFVNGWTDAPNAIATAVGSGAISFRRAAALAAVCNFAGTLLACLFFPAVALTMEQLVGFSQGETTRAALCACLLAIVLWSVSAWRFGLPTSESHGLMAALAGSMLALGGNGGQPDRALWALTLTAMGLSLPAGALAGRLFRRLLRGHLPSAAAWQRRAAALTALLHGAQDGQKFAALLMIAGSGFGIPAFFPALTAAFVMSAGTALGGRPIVEKVGRRLARLSPSEGLAADLGAALILTLCSLLGLPVSTTHAKVAAVCGAGRQLDLRSAGQMAGAWLLTFPCCGLLAFFLTKLMI